MNVKWTFAGAGFGITFLTFMLLLAVRLGFAQEAERHAAFVRRSGEQVAAGPVRSQAVSPLRSATAVQKVDR